MRSRGNHLYHTSRYDTSKLPEVSIKPHVKPQGAYQQGWKACYEGMSLDSNPYLGKTTTHSHQNRIKWVQGWCVCHDMLAKKAEQNGKA